MGNNIILTNFHYCYAIFIYEVNFSNIHRTRMYVLHIFMGMINNT